MRKFMIVGLLLTLYGGLSLSLPRVLMSARMNAQMNAMMNTAGTTAAGAVPDRAVSPLPPQAQPSPATIIRTIVYRQITSFQSGTGPNIERLKMSADGTKIIFTNSSKKIFTINTDGTGFTEVFDYATFRGGCPCVVPFVDISANGSKIIWSDTVGEIFIANFDGSNRQRIATQIPGSSGSPLGPDLVGYSPRITADGTRVYFHTLSDTIDTEGVYVIDANGTNLRKLFSYRQVSAVFGLNGSEISCGYGRFTGNLDISDNGARLIFGTGCTRFPEGDALTYDGTTLKSLVSATGRVAGNANGSARLAISGDGSKVAALQVVGSEERVVFAMNFDGSNQTRLLGNTSVNGLNFGGLTTNGAQVLASTDSHPLPLLNTDGSGRVDLLVSVDCDINPAFPTFGGADRGASWLSADGRRFAFRTTVPGAGHQLWIADINPVSTGDAPKITEATFNPNFVTADGATTSTFTARATDAQGGQGGLRRRLCSNALKNGAFEFRYVAGGAAFGIALYDDGTTGGDQTANDGLFTQTQVRRDLAPPDPVTPLQIRHHAIATSLRQITAVDATPFFVLSQPPGGSGPHIDSLTPSSGPAGIQIKITGTGFDPTPANNIVLFGNRQAVVKTASADRTMLEVIVPPDLSPGVVMVTVTVTAQTSNAVSFTVTGGSSGVTLNDHRMSAGPIPDNCAPPTPKNTFTPNDALAFQWTFVSGFQSGAVVRWEWIQPNGSIFKQFQAPVNNSSQHVCFWDAIDIAGKPAASLPGNWQVRVFYNGTLLVTDNFTIEPATSGGQSGTLYVLRDCNGCGNQIYGYGVNETTGALTLLSGFPISTGGNGSGGTSEQLTIDRTNRRLYAVNDGSNTVSAYSINAATGALTPLPFSPINLGSGSWSTIAVHPTGSPLVIGDGSTNPGRLASFQITATTATAAAGSPFSTGSAAPFSSAFSQNGNFIYTGGNSGTNTAGFSVNAATGVLTALAGSPFNSGSDFPAAYATDAAGRLFVGTDEEVRVFTTTNGIPSAVSGNPFASGLARTDHGILHPNGFYLVADPFGEEVGVYRIQGSGSATTLAAVAGSPFVSGGAWTNVLALNQAGTFLFVANGDTRNLTTFSVNPTTGVLTSPNSQPDNTLGASGRLAGMAYLAASSVSCQTITLSPSTLPGGTVGTAYNQAVSASPAGGNYTFAVTTGPLPAGLSLNSATGAITGTPTAAGTSNFTITATGFGTCTGSQAYTITIQAGVTCPTITNINPTSGAVGSSVTITGTGFTGVSSVKFSSNVAASFTVVNNTTITAQVPSGAINGPITISKAGCNDVQTSSFTVTTTGNCVSVSIANNLTGGAGSSLTVPITVSDLTGKGVTAFDFTLTFDPAVVKLQAAPVSNTGTLSSGLNITTNSSAANKLTVSGFGTTPLAGAGTLLNLKFDLVGATSACSSLALTSFVFNEGTPCATISNGQICIGGGAISGTVNYGTSPTPKPVPGVTLTAAGTPAATSTTNSAGAYSLTGLGGGPYTVTPSKTGDVNGISSFDASQVAQHVTALITLTANQQIAGDASGNGSLSSFDASLIAQTVAGIANSGIAGTWKFVLANRSYPSLSGSQTNQNFDAILVGDVTGNWAASIAASSAQDAAAQDTAHQSHDAAQVIVAMPDISAASGTSVTIPLKVGDLTSLGIFAYDFTLTFDPNVLQLQNLPVAVESTLSSEMTITTNLVASGRLVISAFGVNALAGSGVLLNLRFNVVGEPGASTPLTWQSFIFNERTSSAVNGSFAASNPSPSLRR